MGQNVLITGANGYLGGRLYSYLKEKSTLTTIGSSRSGEHSDRKLNMLSSNDFAQALEDIDCVVHLAALNYAQCEADPELAQKVNVEAVQQLLQTCTKSQVKKFIYLSTVHVYGSPLIGQLSEEASVKPTNHYARTHFEAEELVRSSSITTPIVIRLSNAIGAPHAPTVNAWSLVANDLCRQVVQAKQIKLSSAGLQYRNFIGINSLCSAIEHFITSSKAQFDLYNLGSKSSIQIIQLAELVQQQAKAELDLTLAIDRPAPQGPVSTTLDFDLDLSRASSEGLALDGQLSDEIKQTILFCKQHFC